MTRFVQLDELWVNPDRVTYVTESSPDEGWGPNDTAISFANYGDRMRIIHMPIDEVLTILRGVTLRGPA